MGSLDLDFEIRMSDLQSNAKSENGFNAEITFFGFPFYGLIGKSEKGFEKLSLYESLRANFCKYRESSDSFKIFNSFIFCPNKAFSELFSKIQLKDPKALEFFQNRGKFENRHFGPLPAIEN